MRFRNSLVYTSSCILYEGNIVLEKINKETILTFKYPIVRGDVVFPCKEPKPTDYYMPTVRKKKIEKPPFQVQHSVFGIVLSEPQLIKMPLASVSDWSEIVKNEYYRVAAVEIYNIDQY